MQNPIIKSKDLSVVFGSHTVLDSINLEIDEGALVAVVGPNGGGKTTLLKCMLGIISPSAGTIEILNTSPNNLSADKIGYVPQIKTLDRSFPALPLELVATGIRRNWIGILRKNEKDIALEALNKVGAAHLANKPLIYLSGGELQRIYLARSIVRQPKILILDEPSTGIDIAGESDFNKLIDHYKELTQSTIIMVTHDWEAAFHHADKILLINKKIIAYDTPKNAFNEDSLRHAFGHVGHQHEMLFVYKENK